MNQVLNAYYRLLQILITLLMFVLIIPVSMQIFSRYTGGLIPRYIWTEEIARFCFIWIVMIGAMIAVRDGTHFDVDVLPHTVSARVEGAFRVFVHCAMLLASAVFLVYGWSFARFGALQYSEIAGLPMLTIYIAWPLAGATMVLFLLEKLIEDVRSLRGRMPPPRHEIPKAE